MSGPATVAGSKATSSTTASSGDWVYRRTTTRRGARNVMQAWQRQNAGATGLRPLIPLESFI